jgi:hypothetical protein
MKGILTAAVLTGLLLGLATVPSRGQQEDKEKPLPIMKEALLGEWVGKSGNTTLRVDFGEREAKVSQEDRDQGIGKGFSAPYKIGDNVVRLGSFAEGRLLQRSNLRVTFLLTQGSLRQGASVILRRTKKAP